MSILQPTSRTQLKRLPERGDYSEDALYAVLDAAFLCHVAFCVEGQPFIIPTSYGRSGSTLFLHGSHAGRLMRAASSGIEVCVSVMILDGVVLARSAFHHSMNYRSAVIFGVAREVVSIEEKAAGLRIISEQIMPGRWSDVRLPNDQELKATSVLAVPLNEASVKVRTGPPKDEEEDYDLNTWAGVLPVQLMARDPVPDATMPAGRAVPDYIHSARGFGRQ